MEPMLSVNTTLLEILLERNLDWGWYQNLFIRVYCFYWRHLTQWTEWFSQWTRRIESCFHLVNIKQINSFEVWKKFSLSFLLYCFWEMWFWWLTFIPIYQTSFPRISTSKVKWMGTGINQPSWFPLSCNWVWVFFWCGLAIILKNTIIWWRLLMRTDLSNTAFQAD